MSAYDNLKCVSIGTEKKMGFERDEFIERTEKQKMWLYTGGAFDRGCDRGDPCSNLNSNFQRAASQGACGCRLGKSASISIQRFRQVISRPGSIIQRCRHQTIQVIIILQKLHSLMDKGSNWKRERFWLGNQKEKMDTRLYITAMNIWGHTTWNRTIINVACLLALVHYKQW